MKTDLAKSGATAVTSVAAAFGLTWWAVAAALIGAAASLQFESEKTPSTLWRLGLRILALGLLAAALASVSSHIPPVFGFTLNDVPIAARALLLGLFANPIYKRLRREAEDRNTPGG